MALARIEADIFSQVGTATDQWLVPREDHVPSVDLRGDDEDVEFGGDEDDGFEDFEDDEDDEADDEDEEFEDDFEDDFDDDDLDDEDLEEEFDDDDDDLDDDEDDDDLAVDDE